MGNFIPKDCCAGRDDEDAKLKGKKMALESHSIDDISRFDKAYDTNDIKEFISLLDSSEPIDKLDEPMHPWAADPRTVGSLSATQIAILAARDSEPELKDEIREYGGIKKLVGMLNSKEDDRVHGSIVALSFLSVNNVKNCNEMFKNGLLPYLIKCMSSNIDGLKAASAQTARNIYILGLNERKEFLRLGGIPLLVNLLTPPSQELADKPESWYTPLEAIYHIEDLIVDQNEELIEYTKSIRKAGVVDKLKILEKCNNKDVADAAKILLSRVAE